MRIINLNVDDCERVLNSGLRLHREPYLGLKFKKGMLRSQKISNSYGTMSNRSKFYLTKPFYSIYLSRVGGCLSASMELPLFLLESLTLRRLLRMVRRFLLYPCCNFEYRKLNLRQTQDN